MPPFDPATATGTELTAELHSRRMNAFSMLRSTATATPAELAAMGQRGKTNAEAVLSQFLRADTEIEKLLCAWERAHPQGRDQDQE